MVASLVLKFIGGSKAGKRESDPSSNQQLRENRENNSLMDCLLLSPRWGGTQLGREERIR